ncbi:MAG: cytochrome c biogenesis protein CcdA [Anaerolineales bacterium]
MNITIGLAFLAGLASFLSPCVFALVPAYIGYLGGRAAGGEVVGNNRLVTFLHGVAFVLGFSVVFISLGLAASAIGGLLYDARDWLAKIGGLVVVIFGLHMIGVFRISFLEYDTRVNKLPDPRLGFLASFLMGIFFSAGWSPCVGPVLGAILTLALNSGDIGFSAVMLTAYSAGLAIPFLIAALGIGWVTVILRRHGKTMRYVEIAMGVILIIVGLMLIFGVFNLLANYGFFIDLGL